MNCLSYSIPSFVNPQSRTSVGAALRSPLKAERAAWRLLILDGIPPHRRFLTRGSRNGNVKTVAALFARLGITCGACTYNRRHFGETLKMVGIFLLKDIDKTLSARNVNTFAIGIIIHVIHIGDTRQSGYDLTGVRVKHRQPGGSAGHMKNPGTAPIGRLGEVSSKMKGHLGHC